MFYYAGFNASKLFSVDENVTIVVNPFTEVPFAGLTDFQIGWGYFLLWKGDEVYICKSSGKGGKDSISEPLQIPEKSLDSLKQAAIGKDSVIVLSKDNEIWRYKIYENCWQKVINFIPGSTESKYEYPVKVSQGGCTVALTNLGRVFNVPTLVDMPKRVQFTDIACGFDHTVLLAGNGDVYSMGTGTRGQLGHDDLEDSDNPRLIEALAGIKVAQISAAGWHTAVITDQGDLYTWGWNTQGELGLPDRDTKVIAVPALVDFTSERNENVEVFVKKVQCGNTFTVCMADDGTLWGCGSNKYGQLGQPRESLSSSSKFVRLTVPLRAEAIEDFNCGEWGTVLKTDR